MHSFGVNTVLILVYSNDTFTRICQGFYTGIGAMVILLRCQWSNPEGWTLNTTTYEKARSWCISHKLYVLTVLPAFNFVWCNYMVGWLFVLRWYNILSNNVHFRTLKHWRSYSILMDVLRSGTIIICGHISDFHNVHYVVIFVILCYA